MLRFIILLIYILPSTILFAQDLHYSYYQFTPLTVNPALAGAFSGSYRINGIYSEKQAALSARSYRTFTVSADSPILKGLRKRDWIGVGIEASLFSPVNQSGLTYDPLTNSAASLAFQTWNTYKMGLAYHLSLDKKQTRIFTLGAQYSNNNRSFLKLANSDGRVFPSTNITDLDIQEFNKSFSSQNGDKLSIPFGDLMVGLLYNVRAKKSDLKFGAAIEGLTRPKTTLIKNRGNEKKYIGINVHGAYEMEINKQLRIIPGFYFYSLGPANGLNINTHAHYKINPDKDFLLKGGVGLRNLRAASIYLGGRAKGIDVGFAFDVDMSSAVIGSKGVGGFELVASYMGLIYKKPKVKPEVFCPRL
jgi:type IX secretion system PorP/SprF family membrane protein